MSASTNLKPIIFLILVALTRLYFSSSSFLNMESQERDNIQSDDAHHRLFAVDAQHRVFAVAPQVTFSRLGIKPNPLEQSGKLPLSAQIPDQTPQPVQGDTQMLDMNASAIDYTSSATCQQARFLSPAQDAALASPTPQINVDNDNYSCSHVCPKASAHGGNRLLSDTSQYDWVPCHNRPEILTYLDGRKRWFHCSNCAYFSDRAYHAQMHYQRIHVNQGRSAPRKRKYAEGPGNPSILRSPDIKPTSEPDKEPQQQLPVKKPVPRRPDCGALHLQGFGALPSLAAPVPLLHFGGTHWARVAAAGVGSEGDRLQRHAPHYWQLPSVVTWGSGIKPAYTKAKESAFSGSKLVHTCRPEYRCDAVGRGEIDDGLARMEPPRGKVMPCNKNTPSLSKSTHVTQSPFKISRTLKTLGSGLTVVQKRRPTGTAEEAAEAAMAAAEAVALSKTECTELIGSDFGPSSCASASSKLGPEYRRDAVERVVIEDGLARMEALSKGNAMPCNKIAPSLSNVMLCNKIAPSLTISTYVIPSPCKFLRTLKTPGSANVCEVLMLSNNGNVLIPAGKIFSFGTFFFQDDGAGLAFDVSSMCKTADGKLKGSESGKANKKESGKKRKAEKDSQEEESEGEVPSDFSRSASSSMSGKADRKESGKKRRAEEDSEEAESEREVNRMKGVSCFEVMLSILDKDPSATFEISHKGKLTAGCIDQSGIFPRISSNNRDFDTVYQWIKDTTEMKHCEAKSYILYKGQKIKHIERTLDFGSDDNKVKGKVTELSAANETWKRAIRQSNKALVIAARAAAARKKGQRRRESGDGYGAPRGAPAARPAPCIIVRGKRRRLRTTIIVRGVRTQRSQQQAQLRWSSESRCFPTLVPNGLGPRRKVVAVPSSNKVKISINSRDTTAVDSFLAPGPAGISSALSPKAAGRTLVADAVGRSNSSGGSASRVGGKLPSAVWLASILESIYRMRMYQNTSIYFALSLISVGMV